jgi:hypothetical protein
MLGGRVLKPRRRVRLAGKLRAYRDRPTNSVLSKASVVGRGDGFPMVGQSAFSVVLCA